MNTTEDAGTEGSFKVQSNASLGRHVVATRLIPAGAVILREQPLVVAPSEPSQADRVTCLGCCTVVLESRQKLCPGCGGPLCQASCEDSPYHRDECDAMKQCNFRFENGTSPNHLKLLAFLRVLLQKGEKAERLRRLESHSKRLLSDRRVVMQMSLLVEHLMPPLLKYSMEERVWAYGVMEVNSFAFSEPHAGREALVLMDVVSMLNHSCVCNAYGSCYSRPEGATGPAALDGLRKVVVAATDIAAGSVVTVNYSHPHMHTERRREELRQGKFFTCRCPRCEDPAELGLNPRALCCLPCQKLNAPQLHLLSSHCRDYLQAVTVSEPGFGLRMARVNLTLNRTLLEMIKRTAKLPPSNLTLARMKEADACLSRVITALRFNSDMQATLREQQQRTDQVRGLLALLGILKQTPTSSPDAPQGAAP